MEINKLSHNPPLAEIELRLRGLLPASLYTSAWVDSSPATLIGVFEHLRTLRYIIHDYVPKQVSESPPNPGEVSYQWQEGTLLFTDLAGFTSLLEANAALGRQGAETLLGVINDYFASMIEIVSKSGGDLLEFTGDAMLVQFLAGIHQEDTARAVRAGLRMQRAMAKFARIETPRGVLSLRMRVGIHCGRYITADIGTPMRMAHVLLGHSVQQAKQAEGSGTVGRVCLTTTSSLCLGEQFRFEPGAAGYFLVVDDLTEDLLGEYDITLTRRRMPSSVLLDRSISGLVSEIQEALNRVEPLASYIPKPILRLLVENANRRKIPPDFPEPTVMFVNLVGLPESIDKASPEEEVALILGCSRVFASIDAVVSAKGGVLQKVTAHLNGSDMLIYFGVPDAHRDDACRAASAALAIREIITTLEPPIIGSQAVKVSCQIGLYQGPVFAAEVGEPRGRREFNVLGDTVNTAARLMSKAGENEILIGERVFEAIGLEFNCEALGAVALKGKSALTPIFALHGSKVENGKG
ncbi:MAG: adenylate/guanylate cyclase domain-containing protein [Oscillatoriales cyanobacterium]|uniref:Adenylate/guanylate cyclase domain-containing protein n=1 Tax=Microcoleus anatoxicus PTRS2 TaxID=2705321 RepID=A0ABU8YJ30_9CYAN|nr:MAG: adenylate/guanylate cyclase domain-containing protein [Oscillatoriales cyanobacterium]TAD94628.1 MAG: adenylate/guanylate cyclase domain-containing protein [Oscillatoriales cyanobacterium]TAE02329.1 MAG: adenylate/guanylate cyclase domain-containing protein [Oscillatoriales cyanobacterium]TAE99922.1 MAG: adenylate/guanylate cyclase domain-containing protein [Oscillatoriales cyanobacterium]TAF37100.1 MAG: adenylate/guanylate cyclase domain-containing protein [Oscillatoriales cyanobacteri